MAIGLNEFEASFREHYKMLCNVSYNIIRDRDKAEDIVQETYLKIWDKREEINITGNLKNYLYKAISNASISFLESNRKLVRFDEVELNARSGADEDLVAQETKIKIRKALDKLPARCKAIFILSRFEGMKYKEIAEYLDISVKTVEAQMSIALDRMRTEMKSHMGAGFVAFIIMGSSVGLFNYLSLL